MARVIALVMLWVMLCAGCQKTHTFSPRFGAPQGIDAHIKAVRHRGKAVAIIDAQGNDNYRLERIPGAMRVPAASLASYGYEQEPEEESSVVDIDDEGEVSVDMSLGLMNGLIDALSDDRAPSLKRRQRVLHDRLDHALTVVIYGESQASSMPLMMQKRLWRFGYKDVTIVQGGIQAWKLAGLPVETGPPEEPLNSGS